jgi:hypothetical protein
MRYIALIFGIAALSAATVLAGDAPDVPTGPDAIAVKRHNAAIVRANQMYAKLIAGADRQYLQDLQTALADAQRLGKTDDAARIQQEISDANDETAKVDALAGEGIPLAPSTPPDVPDPKDPMTAAIKHHKVVEGMSEKQMREAMMLNRTVGGVPWSSHDEQSEADGVVTYIWHIGFTSMEHFGGQVGPTGGVMGGDFEHKFNETRTVTVDVKSGIVTHVGQTRDEAKDQEPD